MNSRATAQPPSNRKTAEVASMVNMADIVVEKHTKLFTAWMSQKSYGEQMQGLTSACAWTTNVHMSYYACRLLAPTEKKQYLRELAGTVDVQGPVKSLTAVVFACL